MPSILRYSLSFIYERVKPANSYILKLSHDYTYNFSVSIKKIGYGNDNDALEILQAFSGR